MVEQAANRPDSGRGPPPSRASRSRIDLRSSPKSPGRPSSPRWPDGLAARDPSHRRIGISRRRAETRAAPEVSGLSECHDFVTFPGECCDPQKLCFVVVTKGLAPTTVISVRSEPTQARSRKTVNALLAAAEEEFGEHGYEAAQMTRIAERAQVSVGSMYRFFPDKDSLCRALGDAYIDTITTYFGPDGFRVRNVASIPATLAAVLEASADLRFRHPGVFRLSNEIGGPDQPAAGPARDGLIEYFLSNLEELGVTAARDAPPLRSTLNTMADVSLGLLASLPPDRERYLPILEELAVMLNAYFDRRTRVVATKNGNQKRWRKSRSETDRERFERTLTNSVSEAEPVGR